MNATTRNTVEALMRIFGVLSPEQVRSDLADLGAHDLPDNREIKKVVEGIGGWVSPVTGMLHLDGGHPLRYDRLLALEGHSFAFHRLGSVEWRRQRAVMVRAWIRADMKAARDPAWMAA